jgi:lysozyme
MPSVNLARLKEQLTLHEGLRLFPYKDTIGILTIGIGHNLTANGLHPEVVALQFNKDVEAAVLDLEKNLPWVMELDEVRLRVLIDMCFNLGISRLLKFKNTLAAIHRGEYEHASAMLMDSLWAHQVGDGYGGRFDRAERLAEMMRTGIDWTK